MLRKQYRLTSSAQIKDVQKRGRSWHNRWLVLLVQSNDHPVSRFAFSVGRRLGKAVVRNRIKRVMRECVRRRLSSIPGGWDVLLIARSPAREARFEQIDGAIADLLARSRLDTEMDDQMPQPQPAASPLWESNAHGACKEGCVHARDVCVHEGRAL